MLKMIGFIQIVQVFSEFFGRILRTSVSVKNYPAGFYVSEIAYPDSIRFSLIKPLAKNIFAFAFIGRSLDPMRLDSAHFRQIHTFHYSVHSADANVYAIITLKT